MILKYSTRSELNEKIYVRHVNDLDTFQKNLDTCLERNPYEKEKCRGFEALVNSSTSLIITYNKRTEKEITATNNCITFN